MKYVIKSVALLATLFLWNTAAMAQYGGQSAQIPVQPQWLQTGIFPERDIPQLNTRPNYFAISLVIPEAEVIKARSESFSARLAFPDKSAVIEQHFADNGARLQEIEGIFSNLRNDRNVAITEVRIIGYASPYGYENENTELSKERSAALSRYISTRYGVNASYFWRGEDWTGLVRFVEASSIADKAQIINIIRTIDDVNLRKIRLRQLSGGNTYRLMQRVIFPALNRADYTISYNIKAFSPNEAVEILYSNPKQLSLQELYSLAATYQFGSREFMMVFDVASRLYPTDIASQINNAALEIVDGAYERAINHLIDISDPAAVNNMGVAYAKMGAMTTAVYYFRKAAELGSIDANNNLALSNYWGFK